MSDSPFEAPGAFTGSQFPSMKQLGSGAKEVTRTYAKGTPQEQDRKTKGRLVLIRPTGYERNVPAPNGNGKPRDRITADVTVFDGEPIPHVLDKDDEVTFEFEEPLVPIFTLEGLYISQTMLVGQLRKAARDKGMVLGRLGQLPAKGGNNKPWVLLSFTQEEADMAAEWVRTSGNPFAGDDDDD